MIDFNIPKNKSDKIIQLTYLAKNTKEWIQRINTASLDRINSKKGYVEGNIQWVHKDINMMKHCLETSDFIKWCEKINENFKEI